ncbi:hypothetical protein [Ornithinibacillus californiensis]|uniref:hypothetical protein n=1 Tax=Ornithinibacillus californiensis TaxID=161536 RepID=UPI001F36891F|nr:hypothetical protein [Ornithinibacillus californiensis]
MRDQIRFMCKSFRLAYVADIYEEIQFDSPTQFLEALFTEEFRLKEKAKYNG